jgi:hypothetical protein
MDFSGVPVAEIFNGSVVARSQAMDREQPEEPELAPAPSITPQSLFGAERGADLFSMPRQSVAPSPVAAQSSVPGEYPDMGIYDAPLGSAPSSPEDFIFQSEARRDAKGRLQVYTPPSGDGGGSFEVAGITARFQPKEAARLKALVESGQTDQAEAEAKDFYRRRAAPFVRFTENKGVQFQVSDIVHHRGEGGLRRVLQRATMSDSKDYGELIGELNNMSDPLDALNAARQDYEWEEVERGRASRKKFRPGLQNRFNKADAAARRLITGE